jgi:hypothetical protein
MLLASEGFAAVACKSSSAKAFVSMGLFVIFHTRIRGLGHGVAVKVGDVVGEKRVRW